MWCSTSLTSREIFPCLQRLLAQGMEISSLLSWQMVVLLFCLGRRKQRNSPGALLCCAVCGTRFIKGLCGREHRRERRQVGGAGSCTAPESIGVLMLTGTSWGRQDSQATGLLSVLSCWEQDIELALRSPAWGQPGGEEANSGHPFLNVWPHTASISLHCAGCWHVVPVGCPHLLPAAP